MKDFILLNEFKFFHHFTDHIFYMIAILMGKMDSLGMVLTFISLVASEAEHFLMLWPSVFRLLRTVCFLKSLVN